MVKDILISIKPYFQVNSCKFNVPRIPGINSGVVQVSKNRAQSIVKRKFKNYTNIRITQYNLINPKHFKIN